MLPPMMMSQTTEPNDFPELPPPPDLPAYKQEDIPTPETPVEAEKPKRKKFGGAKRPEAEATGEIVSTGKRREVYVRPEPVKIKKTKLRVKRDKDGKPELIDPLEEEYDQQRLRKEARRRVYMALQALDDVLSPNGRLHKEATPAQILKAAELILERAADRPATALPDDSDKDKHVLILDKSSLPRPRPS